MSEGLILGKAISEWIEEYLLLEKLISLEEVVWVNEKCKPFKEWSRR